MFMNHNVWWHFLSLSDTCFWEAIPEIHLYRLALQLLALLYEDFQHAFIHATHIN